MNDRGGVTRRDFLAASLAVAAGDVFAGDNAAADRNDSVGASQNRSDRRNIASHLISLPKSGGSVSGMGETFTPDLFTGTEGLTVPLPFSQGRSGFGPSLALNYSIANGNGPFGLGWKLDLPSIRRDTQRQLPKYEPSDRFVLGTGADLVEAAEVPRATRDGFRVTTFRLRHETDFSRVERWDDVSGETFWCVTAGNNVKSIYGGTAEARLAHPTDTNKVYLWSLQLTVDDRGNFVRYGYKQDVEAGSQIYLKRICYGNRQPLHFGDLTAQLELLRNGRADECFYEAVVDYGEHLELAGNDFIIPRDVFRERRSWKARADGYSSFRAGFEVATHRLCERVLVFHRVPGEVEPVLVGSLDLSYRAMDHSQVALLGRVVRRGYALADETAVNVSEDFEPGRGVGVRSHAYHVASVPPLDFDYTDFTLANRDDLVSLRSDQPAPERGLDDANHALVDVEGRGLPDIVRTTPNGYFYWRNLGGGRFSGARRLVTAPAGVVLSDRRVGLAEMSGDARADLVVVRNTQRFGYCEAVGGEAGEPGWGWSDYRDFDEPQLPTGFDLSDRNVRLLDLTGDGRLDALATAEHEFRVFECRGRQGFALTGRIPRNPDLKQFPNVYFRDSRVHLADMNGDGLLDIVDIDASNKQIHYWPNLGYGRFGARITMSGDFGAAFEPASMFLADVDGSGPADLVRVRPNGIDIWFNRSGRSWSEPRSIRQLPDLYGQPEFVDLLGTGITGALWSGPGMQRYKYLPLSRTKPALLYSVDNHMGRRVRYVYRPSTELSLADENVRPWQSRPPFPVQVLVRVERHDDVAGTRLVSEFRYAHGYYDSEEQAFRGFGRVEQLDTEQFSAAAPYRSGSETVSAELHQPPVLTKSWFHTGRLVPGTVSRHHAGEYYARDPDAPALPDSELPRGLSDAMTRDACRALAGRLVRTEVYAQGGERRDDPYAVSEHSFIVRPVPEGAGTPSSFFAHDDQTLELHYERSATDPRMSHRCVLSVDAYGHVTASAAVAYPRRPSPDRQPEQERTLATYTKRSFCPPIIRPHGFRHGTLSEEQTFELRGLSGSARLLGKATLMGAVAQARLIGHFRHSYWADDGASVLPAGRAGLRALQHNRYELAFTPELLLQIYGSRMDAALAQESGYVLDQRGAWVPVGDPRLGERVYDTAHFCLPVRWNDPFGRTASVRYDPLWLMVTEVRDPLDNVTQAKMDYRVLLPQHVEDPNGNLTLYAFDPLGRVTATAVGGTVGQGLGDSLRGVQSCLPYRVIAAHGQEPLRNPLEIIGDATTRVVHDLWRYSRSKGAPVVYTLARERHAADARGALPARLQHALVYIDGSGREIQTKTLVAPGTAASRDHAGNLLISSGRPVMTSAEARWAGSGATVYDNKGNVIRKYEPFFSASHQLDPEVVLTKSGVSSLFRYDPLGRQVRTDLPDGAITRVVFSAWREETWDENDTVLESQWYRDRATSSDASILRSAQLASQHAKSPTVVHYDPLQRPFLTVADNGAQGSYSTRSELDIQGNVTAVTDARGQRALISQYDMLKRPVVSRSIDAGERGVIRDVENQPMREWDGVGHETRRSYDALRRPAKTFARAPGGGERLVKQCEYGESLPDARSRNLRGRLYRQYDESGFVTNAECDFKGNVLRSMRRYWRPGQALPEPLPPLANDADLEPFLETDVLSRFSSYDALNRVVTETHGNGCTVAFAYDQGGHPQSVKVRLGDTGPFEAHVADSTYNARGQCVTVIYGNGVRAENTYDPFTFRLARLRTRGPDNTLLQDLNCVYDAVGNVVDIQDAIPATVYSCNQQILARRRFEYDAVYRLVRAEGREHRGQVAWRPQLPDRVPVSQCHPNDRTALRNYQQDYVYDQVGNLLSIRHTADGGGWTSKYEYATGTNRLIAAGPDHQLASYAYDPNGNLRRTTHLTDLTWDHANRLRTVTGGGVQGTYAYDGAGLRARKIVRRGANIDDRASFGDFDVTWSRVNARLIATRQTLHVAWNGRRVSSVDWTRGSGPVGATVVRTRYTLADQLRSVQVALDERGTILSYEEYHPFGTSAYRFAPRPEDASEKRFRFVGKELDEESGLYYFGARYYAPWLGRWSSCDPLGLEDGPNPYAYVGNNPLRYVDPTGASRQPNEEQGGGTWTSRESPGHHSETKSVDGQPVFERHTFTEGSTIVGKARDEKGQVKEDQPDKAEPAASSDKPTRSGDGGNANTTPVEAARTAKRTDLPERGGTKEEIPNAPPGIIHRDNASYTDPDYVIGRGGVPVARPGTPASAREEAAARQPRVEKADPRDIAPLGWPTRPDPDSPVERWKEYNKLLNAMSAVAGKEVWSNREGGMKGGQHSKSETAKVDQRFAQEDAWRREAIRTERAVTERALRQWSEVQTRNVMRNQRARR